MGMGCAARVLATDRKQVDASAGAVEMTGSSKDATDGQMDRWVGGVG